MNIEARVFAVLVEVLTKNSDLPIAAIASSAQAYVPAVLGCLSTTSGSGGSATVRSTEVIERTPSGAEVIAVHLSEAAQEALSGRIVAALAELGKDTQPPADWKERVLASAGHWLEAKERDVLIKLRMQTPAGGLNRDEIAVLDQLIASPVIGASVEASVYNVVRRLAGEVLASTFPNAPDHCARAAHTIATRVAAIDTPATRVIPSPPGQDG